MTPTRDAPGKSERLHFRFSAGAASEHAEPAALDSRAIHRTLIGLRDRLRLQEDELDRLRETVWSATNGMQPASQPAPQTVQQPTAPQQYPQFELLEARIEAMRAEMLAHMDVKRPIAMPTPALDPKALDQAIQIALNAKIPQVAGDIQEKVERTVIPQTHALETQVAEQGRMLEEAFSVMGRTDTNLRRLIAQVDRLLEEVSRRPQPASHIDVTSEATEPPQPRRSPMSERRFREPLRPRARDRAGMFTAVEDLDEFEDRDVPRFRWKFPLAILALLIAILTAVWYFGFREEAPAAPPQPSIGYKLSPLEQARAYETDRNYPKAEQAYRELLAKDPGDPQLIRHLASVLYREDKVEESDEVMKKLGSVPAAIH